MGLWKTLKRLNYYFKKRDLDEQLRNFAIGLSSEVDIRKDLHILFMDFDNVDLGDVEQSVGECQQFFNLSDCFIYKTKNGYHAYFFYDIMPYSRVLMILNYAKFVDPMFRFISKNYDYKTIRAAGKYKERDIFFAKVVKGLRAPNTYELEIGDLKRRERNMIVSMKGMLNKENLK
jgi:hypothetical protein